MADKEWVYVVPTGWTEYTGGGVDPAPTGHTHTIDQVEGLGPRLVALETDTPWAHGIQPRVVWDGSAWPTRASVLPTGYTDAVEYWSPYDATATPPSDRVLNDLWTRKRTT